jgi:hypothetical protein
MIRYSYLESGICHDLFKAPGHSTKSKNKKTKLLKLYIWLYSLPPLATTL